MVKEGAHDLARLGGRIIVGQHPDGILHAIGVHVADKQQIPGQILEVLPSTLAAETRSALQWPWPSSGSALA